MEEKLKSRIVGIISKKILTPIIYMLESDDVIDFICFCDRNITMGEIYDVETELKRVSGKNTEIIDIREFGESERLDIIGQAEIIYSGHPMIESLFARSMLEDYKMAMEERKYVLDRHKECGTCYLQ